VPGGGGYGQEGRAAGRQGCAEARSGRVRAATGVLGTRRQWPGVFAFDGRGKHDTGGERQPASTPHRVVSQTLAYDALGNVTSSADDANDFYDRSLGTVSTASGTNQMQSASSNGNGAQVLYDAAGNITSATVTYPSGAQPNLEFAYTRDEVGRLATAERSQDGFAIVQDTYAYDAKGACVIGHRAISCGPCVVR